MVWSCLWLIGTLLAAQTVSGEATFIAKIAQSGESVEVEQQNESRTISSSLPLYRSGAVRYFSAGVGLEERSAQYPPLPLKFVFTAGDKPFVSGVGMTIQPAKGGATVTILPEQVEGPWLFVELVPGLYDVSATFGDQTQRLRGIRIELGEWKVVYLRWKEDRGPAVRIAGDRHVDSAVRQVGKEVR